MISQQSQQPSPVTRREFVETTAAATAGLVAVGRIPYGSPDGSDTLRVGVIGCGGRGTGAARDNLRSSEGVELVALGDLFADRVARCRQNLAEVAAEDPGFAAKLNVADDHTFTGFDAYQRVLQTDIDIVCIATPPAFRPVHVTAAVDAGKHIFMEKPVAVDPVGIRTIVTAADRARRAGLAIVAGTQRRHQTSYLEAMRRIHDGAIGEIVGGQVYWNQGGLWARQREPGWSDVEWQIRNWLYFTWLSGDHIVEQHVHNLDVANWALQAHPVRAVGMGGRQWRTDPLHGHIYDHFAVDFEYPNGVHVMSMCRQIDNTASYIGERFVGTSGMADPRRWIEGATTWQYEASDDDVGPYVQEHADLVASIRSGELLNEGRQVAESTLTAIMGREAAYTGQEITWEQMENSIQDLAPDRIDFGPRPVDPVAMPGETVLDRTWKEVEQ